MSLTTIEQGKQLYTILWKYRVYETQDPTYVIYMGLPLLTTDHGALMEYAKSLVSCNPNIIYSVSMVIPTEQ